MLRYRGRRINTGVVIRVVVFIKYATQRQEINLKNSSFCHHGALVIYKRKNPNVSLTP